MKHCWMVEPLDRLLSAGDVPDRTLAVVDGTQPAPVMDLFEEAFGSLEVDLTTRDIDADVEEAVVLVEDDDVVATSSIDSLRDTVLLVNSDL